MFAALYQWSLCFLPPGSSAITDTEKLAAVYGKLPRKPRLFASTTNPRSAPNSAPSEFVTRLSKSNAACSARSTMSFISSTVSDSMRSS